MVAKKINRDCSVKKINSSVQKKVLDSYFNDFLVNEDFSMLTNGRSLPFGIIKMCGRSCAYKVGAKRGLIKMHIVRAKKMFFHRRLFAFSQICWGKSWNLRLDYGVNRDLWDATLKKRTVIPTGRKAFWQKHLTMKNQGSSFDRKTDFRISCLTRKRS